MAASERTRRLDEPNLGAEALGCEKLHRRNSHYTYHLSLYLDSISISLLLVILHATQAYHERRSLVKRCCSDFRRMFVKDTSVPDTSPCVTLPLRHLG